MAGDTPLHLQGVLLKNGRHRIDLAMAGRTPNTFGYVNTVIEVSVFGQIVHPLPLDRLVIAKAGSNRFQVRAV